MIEIRIADVSALTEQEAAALIGFFAQFTKSESETEMEPANDNPPELDKDGVAWDERIHSGSRSLSANGTWRKRKGASSEASAPFIPDPPAPKEETTIPDPPAPKETPNARDEFAQLVNKITDAIGKKKLTQPEVVAELNKQGFDKLPNLQSADAAKIAEVSAAFDALLFMKDLA